MQLPSTFFGWVRFLLEQYGPLFLSGVGVTLIVAITGTLAGFLLGLLVAILRTIPTSPKDPAVKRVPLKILSWLLGVYIEVFRGTPMIVQAMVIYYGGMTVGVRLPVLTAAILIVSVNTGAYMAEIIRGGLMAVDGGQMEAGRSLGLNYFDTMRFIVIPQAIKAILPALGNEFIILLKDTSLITVIGGKELLHAAQGIMGRTYEAMFPLIGIACMYLVLVMIFTWLLGKLERRLRQSDRR